MGRGSIKLGLLRGKERRGGGSLGGGSVSASGVSPSLAAVALLQPPPRMTMLSALLLLLAVNQAGRLLHVLQLALVAAGWRQGSGSSAKAVWRAPLQQRVFPRPSDAYERTPAPSLSGNRETEAGCSSEELHAPRATAQQIRCAR